MSPPGDPFDRDRRGQRVPALPADGLALARGEGGEEVVEGAVALVEPVELLVVRAQEAVARRGPRPRASGRNVAWIEEAPGLVAQGPQPGDQVPAGAPSTRRPSATSSRGPVTGVNGTETWSFG